MVGIGGGQRPRDVGQGPRLRLPVGDRLGDVFGAVRVGGGQRSRDVGQGLRLRFLSVIDWAIRSASARSRSALLGSMAASVAATWASSDIFG